MQRVGIWRLAIGLALLTPTAVHARDRSASSGHICGALDDLGAAFEERARQQELQRSLSEALGSEGAPTKAQVQALLINPATRQLGEDLLMQRLGTADFPFPSNEQLQAMIANPATMHLGMAIYRRKMGLPPER